MLNDGDREASLKGILNLSDSESWKGKNKCYYMKATFKRNWNKV